MTIKEYLDIHEYSYDNNIRYRIGKAADALYYAINKVYPARVEFRNSSGYLYRVNDYVPEFLDDIMPFILDKIEKIEKIEEFETKLRAGDHESRA